MKHHYLYIYLFIIVLMVTLLSTAGKALAILPDTIKTDTQQDPKQAALVDTRNNRPKDLNLAFKPFTPIALSYKNDIENNKVLSNVKVFPNPVSDQINLAFKLNKDIKVTIKVMDALGNDITTLLSQQLTAGEQNHGFMLTGKLNTGYYFIRVMAGTETIVKRIQVL